MFLWGLFWLYIELARVSLQKENIKFSLPVVAILNFVDMFLLFPFLACCRHPKQPTHVWELFTMQISLNSSMLQTQPEISEYFFMERIANLVKLYLRYSRYYLKIHVFVLILSDVPEGTCMEVLCTRKYILLINAIGRRIIGYLLIFNVNNCQNSSLFKTLSPFCNL